MPQCSESKTTASHRPANIFLFRAYLLVEAIRNISATNGHQEIEEPRPSKVTAWQAAELVSEVPFWLIGEPDIDPFYGEVHLSWSAASKQVVLMCFPNQGPLIHHYQRIPDSPSRHDIEAASADRLAFWLGWLRA